MKSDKMNAKEKIYQAAMELLTDTDDVYKISTRQITAKAGVNLALVNYYYQSKENLLSEIVGKMMDGIIRQIIMEDSAKGNAESRLRGILIATADAAFKHANICQIAISVELKKGCRNSCAMIIPFLKDLLQDYSETDLAIAAMQLMLPFHHIVLEPELYGEILGTDFADKEKRDLKIDQMISCALAGLSHHIT